MTQHVLSLSYGKDSLACLGAIEKLGLPLDRIVHAEVWATDTIPADLPPMVEFKKKADAIIKERWGITVEHIYATKPREREREREREKVCYADLFYESHDNPVYGKHINGFPKVLGGWCKRLKYSRETDIRGYLLSSCAEAQAERERERERIYGFPMVKGNWCTSDLKQRALRQSGASIARGNSKLRLSDLSPPGKLVHIPQTESFPTAPWHKVRT